MSHVKTDDRSVWARIVAAFLFVLRMEPVAVTAVWRAVVVLLGAAGLTVNDVLDGRVVAVIAALYALIELLTTMRARASVSPTARVVEVVEDGTVYAGPASELATGTPIRPAGSLGGNIYPPT